MPEFIFELEWPENEFLRYKFQSRRLSLLFQKSKEDLSALTISEILSSDKLLEHIF